MFNYYQVVSIVVWNDEEYVCVNCVLYVCKFDVVLDIFGELFKVSVLDVGFYLWFKILVDDEIFVCCFKFEENVIVLFGCYLLCIVQGCNFGKNWVCMVLVVELDQCVEGV